MESNELRQKVLVNLRNITWHDYVKLTNRGNSAILAAFHIAKQLNKDTILIPDQGGWISYKTYPSKVGLSITEIKTDEGIIDLDSLKKLANEKTALIVPSFAGYFAEQPIEKIAKICKEQSCLLIEDASGAIGDKKLCNGRISDIIVASFGKWKPVDLGYGGFVSAGKKEYFNNMQDIFSTIEFDDSFIEKLDNKLNNVKKRLDSLLMISKKIKKELSSFDIAHPDKRGINVMVKFKSEEEKKKILDYCEKNGYEHTICPRYIRLNENAVSIEVKRLQPASS